MSAAERDARPPAACVLSPEILEKTWTLGPARGLADDTNPGTGEERLHGALMFQDVPLRQAHAAPGVTILQQRKTTLSKTARG